MPLRTTRTKAADPNIARGEDKPSQTQFHKGTETSRSVPTKFGLHLVAMAVERRLGCPAYVVLDLWH